MKRQRRKFVLGFLLFIPQIWLFLHLNSTVNVERDPVSSESRRNLKELIFRHGKSGGDKFSPEADGFGRGSDRASGHMNFKDKSSSRKAVVKDPFGAQRHQDPIRQLEDAPFSPSINHKESITKDMPRLPAPNQLQRTSYNQNRQLIASDINNSHLNITHPKTRLRFSKQIEDDFRERLRDLKSQLFTDDLGAVSDSSCAIPEMPSPNGTCPDVAVGWKCDMAPTFSTLDTQKRTISVKCSGRWRVNHVDRTEHEHLVTRGSYRNPPKWQYYQGHQEITMETEYADVVCKSKRNRNMHNYHTQFLPKPNVDRRQQTLFHMKKAKEPNWRPLSVLTVVLDSLSQAHAHRGCGLPKTMALLEQLYDGRHADGSFSSHQAFLFNRYNSISSATALNLTPMFSGELYEDLDMDRIRQGVYGKDVQEWIWEYASHRGYLTSYGVDNNSGIMGTRTKCKACHYRPPVLAHTEHGWVSRENEQVISNVLSGFCDGNHMIHEHILNYTREFLRHLHPAKWAAIDLNAGHRKEMESINQIDDHLSQFLRTVLQENPNLVVFVVGDHGKPYHKNPGHLGGYYETLLPFLSVVMPTWVIHEAPSIMDNLIMNQQRYLVPADLHLSMKSLLHFPDLQSVTGIQAPKSINIFSQTIPAQRGCQDAYIPEWSCVCGYMRKLSKNEWTDSHVYMVQLALDDVNNKHSKERLSSITIEGEHFNSPTSCLDLHFHKILHIFVNENPGDDAWLPQRYIYHITFQTIEMNTVWRVIIDNGFNIKQIKQLSMYQKFDVCWDHRVPLPYCVCDNKPVR